jgi:putative transposase
MEIITMLTKTLTFGLGTIFGFTKKDGTLTPFSDEQRKTIYSAIPGLFRDFGRICNYTASLFYSSRVLKVDLEKFEMNKGYLKIVAKLGMKTPLNGLVLNQAYGVVNAHFAGEHGKKLMGSGESVLPTHRMDGTHPLYFHKNAVKIFELGGDCHIAYHVFSESWAKENGVPAWLAFKIKLKPRDLTGREQIARVVSGEWPHGGGQIVRNRRPNGPKYVMHLSVSYEPQPYKELSETTVMGLDLGVTTPAAVHFRTGGEPQKWAMCVGNGRVMLAARGSVRGEIVRLLRALKRKDSPIRGHDRDEAMKRLRDLRKKEQRIMKTASQTLAALIADLAKRNGAKVWQMEKLTSEIKEDKPWLARNWAPGMLTDAIRWQAVQVGADLRFINPRYTSQRCGSCGHISAANRPKGKKGASVFECVKCGHKDHADKNAARNISILEIEKLIEENVKKVPNGTVGS